MTDGFWIFMSGCVVGIPGIIAVVVSNSAWAEGAANMLDPSLGNLMSNLGIIGVLVWHLWYHTTKGYPQMLQAFSVENAKMRDTFEGAMRADRELFREEQRETRAMFLQSVTAMRTAVHDVKDTAQAVITNDAVQKVKRDNGNS
jgi:hypothetical protein